MQNSTPPRTNTWGQPIGLEVPDWRGASPATREPMEGERCRIEALDVDRHGEALWREYAEDSDGRQWTYLPYGPFESLNSYREWIRGIEGRDDTLAFAIVDRASGEALGVACYLRIDPAFGSIEVGHLRFGPRMQRTGTSTEAMYLMMKRVFKEWGYRRYEWKCDSLNSPSRAAALRLGFQFEGTFRNHVVMKGRNRDTSWFSILDTEWPELEQAFLAWLSPRNFDSKGEQHASLAAFQRNGASERHRDPPT